MPISALRLAGAGRLDAQLRCGCTIAAAGQDETAFTTPQWALAWVEHGRATLRDRAGTTWDLTADAVFQRFPDQRLDLLPATRTRWWYLALPAACRDAARRVGLPDIDRQVFAITPPPGLRQRFLRTARELAAAPVRRLPACMAGMLTLAIDLHAAADGGSEAHASAIDQACALLAHDPLVRWSPAGLARQVGLNHHTFRKAFAGAVGCGPTAYRLRLRLERAQDLLATTELPVAMVATRCGWDDPLLFSAVFRRHLGLAPRPWRQRRG